MIKKNVTVTRTKSQKKFNAVTFFDKYFWPVVAIIEGTYDKGITALSLVLAVLLVGVLYIGRLDTSDLIYLGILGICLFATYGFFKVAGLGLQAAKTYFRRSK